MEDTPSSCKGEIPGLMFMCSELYIAAFEGRTQEVTRLLSGDSSTAVVAVANGHPSPRGRSQAIHQGLCCITREVTAQQSTLLHIAAGQGHCELIAELCLRDAALLSLANSSLDTPLHCAARAGHADAIDAIVRLAREDRVEEDLLRALLSSKNKAGDTALHVAARHGHGAAVETLMKLAPEMASEVNGVRVSPLYLAVMSRSVRAIAAIAGYRDASAAGPDSQNALHAAVLQSSGHTPFDLVENSTGFFSMASLVVKLFVSGSQFRPQRQDHIKQWNGQDIMKWREVTSKNLAIVSTLVATVAFSAAFNVPGSYGSDGKANLNGNRMYNTFLLLDTVAVTTAVMATILLIYGKASRSPRSRSWITFVLSLYFLWLSLLSMMLGFYTAIAAVVSDNKKPIRTAVARVIYCGLYILMALLTELAMPGSLVGVLRFVVGVCSGRQRHVKKQISRQYPFVIMYAINMFLFVVVNTIAISAVDTTASLH
nr:unnamed protein product [Digitaria exilis]